MITYKDKETKSTNTQCGAGESLVFSCVLVVSIKWDISLPTMAMVISLLLLVLLAPSSYPDTLKCPHNKITIKK